MKRLTINAFFLILYFILFFVVREEGDSLLDKQAIGIYIIVLFSSLSSIKRKTIAKSKTLGVQTVKPDNFKREFIASTEGATILILLSGVFVFLFVLVLASGNIVGSIIPVVIFTLLFFALLVAGALQSNHPAKLVLSHYGVEYYSLLLKYKCGWEDIKEIASFMNGTDSMILNKATYRKNILTALYFDHKIQLSAFDRHWKRGEIGKLIKQNAPQLKFRKS